MDYIILKVVIIIIAKVILYILIDNCIAVFINHIIKIMVNTKKIYISIAHMSCKLDCRNCNSTAVMYNIRTIQLKTQIIIVNFNNSPLFYSFAKAMVIKMIGRKKLLLSWNLIHLIKDIANQHPIRVDIICRAPFCLREYLIYPIHSKAVNIFFCKGIQIINR